MKLITRDTDYAVRALRYIAASDEELISVKEMVNELKIPRSFLRKIFQILNKKGIVKSYKGKGGGFVLTISPERIFLADLMEVFQGPLKVNECLFKNRPCPNKGVCVLNKKIYKIEKYVIDELKAITLASLLR